MAASLGNCPTTLTFHSHSLSTFSFTLPGANPPVGALDSSAPARNVLNLTHQLTMGQQTNKIIKKKRRVAYLKRKKARLLAAKKK